MYYIVQCSPNQQSRPDAIVITFLSEKFGQRNYFSTSIHVNTFCYQLKGVSLIKKVNRTVIGLSGPTVIDRYLTRVPRLTGTIPMKKRFKHLTSQSFTYKLIVILRIGIFKRKIV